MGARKWLVRLSMVCLLLALHTTATATASAAIAPRSLGQIDCNGFSPIQTELRPTAACADIHGINGGRFYDNGWYIGHDEPAIRFISDAPVPRNLRAGATDDAWTAVSERPVRDRPVGD